MGSSVETWKLEYNIQIGEDTKKSDKNNKNVKEYSRKKMGEIKINYFVRKKNDWRNFKNN